MFSRDTEQDPIELAIDSMKAKSKKMSERRKIAIDEEFFSNYHVFGFCINKNVDYSCKWVKSDESSSKCNNKYCC